MTLVSVECPKCGAALPATEPTGGYRCTYCATSFKLERARGARTVAGVALDPKELAREIVAAQQRAEEEAAAARAARHQAEVQTATKSAGRLALVIVAFTLTLGVGISTFVFVTVRGATSGQGPLSRVGELMNKAVPESLLWDAYGGVPLVTTIRGRPAVIGRTRAVMKGDTLHVDALDLTSGDRLWRIDGLGTASEGYQNVRYADHGDHLVLTDAAARVHVHDLATGKRARSMTLTDRADHICITDDGVAIHQIDERWVSVDPPSGELTALDAPPEGCLAGHLARELAAGGPLRFARQLEGAPGFAPPPELEGLQVTRGYARGGSGVALAKKDPGTPVPFAVGYDPKSLEETWRTPVAAVGPAQVRPDDLFGALDEDRFFAAYPVAGDTWRLAGLDARTGEKVWDTALRPLFAVDDVTSLTADGEFVLLTRGSHLEVFKAADGTLLHTIGQARFD